ncbi:MAG: P22 phage major capsid protein family protein, partial [Nitrosomonadaceae bacterium]
MANDYQSNINKKLLKSFARAFESTTVLLKTVSKQLVNDFDASTGRDFGQVSMKRPPQYVPQRTTDGDVTGSTNPVRTGKVQAEVSDYITVFVENTQVEEALEADQLNQLLEPIAEDMVVELESETATFMANNAALTTGDPDEQLDQWSDVANAGALLKDIGSPSGKRYGVIDCFDEVELANLQTQLGVNPEVMTAWDGAVIKKYFAGLNDVLTTNNLPQYTSGNDITGITLDGTPSPLYTTYKDTYRMSLAMTGFTANTGTLTAGTTLQFPTRFLVNMRNRKTLFKSGV